MAHRCNFVGSISEFLAQGGDQQPDGYKDVKPKDKTDEQKKEAKEWKKKFDKFIDEKVTIDINAGCARRLRAPRSSTATTTWS